MTDGFHAVVPRLDCPHAIDSDIVNNLIKLSLPQARNIVNQSCKHCEETYENWICLTCGTFECSRYINGHMKDHNEINPTHPFAISLVDFSCWCFACNDYIDSPNIKRVHDTIYLAKFNETPQKYTDDATVLEDKLNSLVDMIQKSRKIVSFTGNGICTSAITSSAKSISPRNISPSSSPPTGNLFENAGSNTKEVILKDILPTKAHMALKALSDLPDRNHVIISSNVDDLHKKSGISENHLFEVKRNKAMELNPNDLQEVVEKCKDSDLFLVLGSSMRAAPANQIRQLANSTGARLVIINSRNTEYDNQCDIRIWGAIDDVVSKLFEKLEIPIPQPEFS